MVNRSTHYNCIDTTRSLLVHKQQTILYIALHYTNTVHILDDMYVGRVLLDVH